MSAQPSHRCASATASERPPPSASRRTPPTGGCPSRSSSRAWSAPTPPCSTTSCARSRRTSRPQPGRARRDPWPAPPFVALLVLGAIAAVALTAVVGHPFFPPLVAAFVLWRLAAFRHPIRRSQP